MSALEAATELEIADGLQALFRGEQSGDADLGALFLTKTLLSFMTQGG